MDLWVDYQDRENHIDYGVLNFKDVELDFLEKFYKKVETHSSKISFRVYKSKERRIYNIENINKLKIFIKNEKNNGRK